MIFLIVGSRCCLVAGIDALGAVAAEEVLVELEPGLLLENRHAVLLGAAGIDGRLVDDDVALLEHAADGLAGAFERRQHGPVVLADRRRHRDDERVALGERLRGPSSSVRCLAARSSSLVVSSVESLPRSSSAMRSFLMSKPTVG